MSHFPLSASLAVSWWCILIVLILAVSQVFHFIIFQSLSLSISMSDRGLSTVSFSRSLPVNIDVWSAYVNTTLDMPLAAMSRLHISTRGSRTDDTVGCRFFFPTDLFRLPFLLSTVGRLFSSGSLFWGYLSILWLYSPALSFFPPQPDIPCCHDGVYLWKNSVCLHARLLT